MKIKGINKKIISFVLQLSISFMYLFTPIVVQASILTPNCTQELLNVVAIEENINKGNEQMITEDEHKTKTVVYQDKERYNQFLIVIRILSNKTKYSELTTEEKEQIFKAYSDADEEILQKCKTKGYSLIESIGIALRVKEYELSIEEIESLLSSIKDKIKIDKELSKLKQFKQRIKLTSKEITKIVDLLIKGYSMNDIEPAFIVSSALGLEIEKVIIKNEKLNKKEIIETISEKNTEDKFKTYNRHS
ncbi:hypothetical protein [Caloranaerobacter sp. DY30410]|uniref:hypothetical protein n=1 Tax=Caloranaerobacter sp. DY30410 TaxID=3238305 RepID=UPI003D06FCA1